MEKEVLMNIERKIPAALIFASHEPENQRRISSYYLTKVLEAQLQNAPDGKILALVEDAYMPLSSANLIQNLVKDGAIPSTAYASAIFWEENLRVPRTRTELITYQKKLLKSSERRIELSVLDHFFMEYRGRLGIIWEGTPLEILADEWQQGSPRDHFVRGIKEAIKLAHKGKFDEALTFFKKEHISLAKRVKRREEKLEERILEATKTDRVVGIAGCFGAAHTHIAHFLSSNGLSVQMVFPEKLPERVYLYNPGVVVTRTLRFFPEKEIIELEWLKSLLGEAIYKILIALELSDQEATEITYKALFNFPDLPSIRRFEKQVRKKGFVEAVEELS